jgi:Amidase
MDHRNIDCPSLSLVVVNNGSTWFMSTDCVTSKGPSNIKESAFASASLLASLIRQHEVGCLELLDYVIAPVESLDRKLNAVVVRDFERVRLEARGLDNTTNTGPLHGVPMTIKEGIDVSRSTNQLRYSAVRR